MTDTFKVELWEIGRVKPYEKNAKIHDDAQVEKIAKAIREYGFDQPIVVDKDGVIIKGHGRRLAMIKLGLPKVPVVVRSDLSPEQAMAARLSDNKVHEGIYDTDLIKEELMAMSDFGIDLTAIGFSDKELEFFTNELDDLDTDALINEEEGGFEAEVEKFTKSSNETIGEIEEKELPVSRVLGFRTVKKTAEPLFARFISMVESETGETGGEAMTKWLQMLFAGTDDGR